MRQILLNPFTDHEVLAVLLAVPHLVKSPEVRKALVAHPRTPEAAALGLVGTLFWHDLLDLAADLRVPPAVRHAAERYLIERLVGLTEGERVTLARRASTAVLTRLRLDPSPRVIAAMLENGRLTEGQLLPMLASDSTPPEVLALVAGSRWGLRYEVKVALARNRRTPVVTVLMILPHLRESDLRVVMADPRLAMPVRHAARQRLFSRD